jgi:hypothetical protein
MAKHNIAIDLCELKDSQPKLLLAVRNGLGLPNFQPDHPAPTAGVREHE